MSAKNPRRTLLALGCGPLLGSCGMLEPLAYDRPAQHEISGSYVVESISWLVLNRKKLKRVELTLAGDGNYELRVPDVILASPLIPSGSGKWRLIPKHGLDLASNATWAIRFSPQGKTCDPIDAWLLDPAPPHRFMFSDQSRFEAGEILVFAPRRKAED